MKNTLKKVQFRMMIYKRHSEYVGICYETGWVEVHSTKEEAINHLTNGVKALLETSLKNKLSEKNINRRPPLKYFFIFHILPHILPIIASFKNSFDFSFINESIVPNHSY